MEFQHEIDRNQESRRQSALIVVVIQLVISVTGFTVGLYVYLLTSNLKAGSFWSHACQCFATLLFLVGLLMKHSGKGWMVSGYVFAGIGLIMLLAGAVVDGIQAGHIAETDFSRCVHSSPSGASVCGATFDLWSLSQWKKTCVLAYPANTCYCCYLFHRSHCSLKLWGQTVSHYEGVTSCEQVEHKLKPALWVSMVICIINLCVTVVACVMVSHYKSSVPAVAPLVFTQSAIGGRPAMMGEAAAPVIICTQQQTVHYYPQPIKPPAYDAPSHPPPQPFQVCRPADMPGVTVPSGLNIYTIPTSQLPTGGATDQNATMATDDTNIIYSHTPSLPPPPYSP